MAVTDSQKSGLERRIQFKTVSEHLPCFQLYPLMVSKKPCGLRQVACPLWALVKKSSEGAVWDSLLDM